MGWSVGNHKLNSEVTPFRCADPYAEDITVALDPIVMEKGMYLKRSDVGPTMAMVFSTLVVDTNIVTLC